MTHFESPDAPTLIRQSFNVSFSYDVFFTSKALNPDNLILANLLANSDRTVQILPVVDDSVLACFPDLPEQLQCYFDTHRVMHRSVLAIPGGERCKADPQFAERIVDKICEYAIDRHSYILAIGGGAALDMIGYAAAIAHRGIRLIRMPTTVLAQNDAGIGVKNAINFKDRKNFIGSFAPPYAVINDFNFLTSLPLRDLRSGIAETLKVALLKSPPLFYWCKQHLESLDRLHPEALHTIIKEGARLHLEHIRSSGDPFEMGSARPLDFGHWSAHFLEQLSNYKLRHGEAVALGITLDCLYSHKVGLLSATELADIIDLFQNIGFPLDRNSLGKLDIDRALNEFKEHLGGQLSITLLKSIGDPFEANHIDSEYMQEALNDLKSLDDWEQL